MGDGAKTKPQDSQIVACDSAAVNRVELVFELERKIRMGEDFDRQDLNLLRNVRHLPDSEGSMFLKITVEAFIAQLDDERFDDLGKKWMMQFGEKLERSPDGAYLKSSRQLSRTERKKLKREEYKRKLREGEVPIPKRLRKMLEQAEDSVILYKQQAEMIVGYDDIRKRIEHSVKYWVLNDKKFIKAWHKYTESAPPKVFILKGNSGAGKSMIAEAIMYNATMEAQKKNLPVWAHPIDSHNVITKWLGEATENTAKSFDKAFKHPAIIYVDEAQGLTSARAAGGGNGDSASSEMSRVNDTIKKKINELVSNREIRNIVIFATNQFGALDEAVKRRAVAGTFDLDDKIDHRMLVAVAKRNLQKYKINGIAPEDLVELVESKVRAIGHSYLTPADIANAFEIVVGKKMEALYSQFDAPISSKNVASKLPPITLDDFKNIARFKEYGEGETHDALREILTRVTPKITLADVGGLYGVKEQLYTDLRIALNHEVARKAGSKPIHGVLLYGPPGTGKTWLTQAVCGELKANWVDVELFIVNGAQLFRKYVGETEQLIRNIFDEARKNSPSIIYIDEIESLALNRSAGGHQGQLGAVSTILSEMDGTKPLEGVVVIGTTNRLDFIDDAFKRAGRFDRITEIPAPKTDGERLEIIDVHLRKSKGFMEPSVTPQAVLDLFGKKAFTPAAIERIVNDARELRLKELNAIEEFSQIADIKNNPKFDKLWAIYKNQFRTLYSNLGLKGPAPTSAQEIGPEFIERLHGVNFETYKLTIAHFNGAMEQMRNHSIEEMRKLMEGMRGPAAVGKSYGLAVISDGRGGNSEGAMLVVETYADPHGIEPGTAKVHGSEADESIKMSANHGRIFLSSQAAGAIREYQFDIEIITASKGVDQKVLQGPSAGAAIALAEYSAITNIPIKPNVVITGAITQFGEIFKVGGLDYKSYGKVIAAKNIKGVDTMIIPKSNYDDFPPEELENLRKQGLKIFPAQTFWDVAKIGLALDSEPTMEQLIQKLKDVEKLKQLKRGEDAQPAETKPVAVAPIADQAETKPVTVAPIENRT